ncbi:Sesquiterpene synthase [Rhynchospora pubera]|uniref:Sesquiterpene synthase n=1 Tax=Rhynchospora pubera TaxID=906938 RepID=A0AAV8EPG6_9POAL|nr:Sesquiterpene synthase [Rhynchospora pubera]
MEWMEQRIKGLKEEIKVMYKSATNIAELINLVDTIQHLGIGYHFFNETDDALSYLQNIKLDNEDLQHVAVGFRLLRQHGFNVSSDVFCKFKDSDGNFDENLCKDARGLLSLYNAGYLAYPGETILDDAISFARGHLGSKINDMDLPLKTQVLRALKTPLHRMVPRVEAMFFIEEYMNDKTRNDTLLNLAMVDYNFAQLIHLEELKDLSLWWKDLHMLDNLTCARDRLLENYFWVLGIFFEPHNSRARKILTKYWTILTVVDDMYDVYGTYEECKILTDAFQRWDENAVDDLPIILRDFYQKFVSTINEFQDEVEPSEKYRLSYLIQEIQKLVVCYQQELEWCAKGQVPNFNERKKPAIDGNAGAIVVCILLLGFDEVISEEAINWFMSLPDVVMASMEICRYNDEAASYEREMNAGQGPTSIACFMMEHNLKKDEAAIQFEYFTDESWKKMNKAFLCPTNAPVTLLNWVANYARVCSRENLLGFTYSSKLKEPITSLLLKPFSLKN